MVHIVARSKSMENVPATSRSSPKKQVGSIRATCRDCESEEGPQWTEERKHFVREEAVRSESIARKQVDTANARHGSKRGSEHRSRGSR